MSLLKIWGLISGSWTGRLLAGFVALLIAWKANNLIVSKKAVSRFVEKSVKDGKERNAKNKAVRDKALSTPGSAARLPCRDC